MAMDGNNSLKRMRAPQDRTPADVRVLDSDYFIPREYVDRFAVDGEERSRGPQLHAPAQEDISMRDEEANLDDEMDEIDASVPGHAADTTASVDQASSAIAPGNAGPSGVGNAESHAEETRAGCTTNWKAAKDDSKKVMWGIFDETGIFSSACRHGFCLWNADMVRNGEL